MTTRLVLNHWRDWLEPGSPSDSRLFHSDASDRILVCQSHLGQGYVQEILLRDDLALFIHDYMLNQDLAVDATDKNTRLEFEFHLAGPDAGYSFLIPCSDLKTFGVRRARQRYFKVEVVFKPPSLMNYFQAFRERLSPQINHIGERVIQSIEPI